MIVRLQTGNWNQTLLKLSGQVPVYIGEKRETIRLFEDNRQQIQATVTDLMAPLQTQGAALRDNDTALQNAMRQLVASYPFIELLYTLDEQGIQRSENITVDRNLVVQRVANHRGRDRSRRPYYQQAKEQSQLVITEPYISMATCDYCISAAIRLDMDNGEHAGYAVADFNFDSLLNHVKKGAQKRRLINAAKIASVCAVGIGASALLLI
ncbi:MAG: PDC sensor domain-containing protein [Pseudomonadota bacterium]|nr:PDC sensor domain-containing protein [Pseudomonadota bacterium]